jgi:hypothetical protein
MKDRTVFLPKKSVFSPFRHSIQSSGSTNSPDCKSRGSSSPQTWIWHEKRAAFPPQHTLTLTNREEGKKETVSIGLSRVDGEARVVLTYR